ncbi:hypothetical protein ACFLY9_00445 [Patescibacteria group bacterium]
MVIRIKLRSEKNKLIAIRAFIWMTFILLTLGWLNIYLSSILFLNPKVVKAEVIQGPGFASEGGNIKRVNSYTPINISELSLEERYRNIAGEYYSANIDQYLPAIDKVLQEKDLDNDKKFIKGMFYIGQQESHWSPLRISSFNIKGSFPTGIFQFLPGTFMSVSDGDIFNPEDQIEAFITMWERGRCDEFAVVYTCNYPPCLNEEGKSYMLRK